MGLGPDCRVNEGSSLPSSKSSPCTAEHCGDKHGHAAKIISFFPERFVTLCTTKLLEHLEVTSSTGFLLWDKLNSYASFSIPEDSSHILQAVGTVFGLFSLGDIHVMTSHALSFCFWTKVITPVFIPLSLHMTQGNNSSIISLWHTM